MNSVMEKTSTKPLVLRHIGVLVSCKTESAPTVRLMKSPSLILVVASIVLCALTGCNKAQEYYSECAFHNITESDYTEWMPQIDLQIFVESFDSTEKWILRAEGRDYKGLSQYRYAIKNKPENAVAYQIRSGRDDAEFYALGIQYQRDGYKRVSLQLFKDSSGTTRYQGVWFKYKSGEQAGADQPATAPESKPEGK